MGIDEIKKAVSNLSTEKVEALKKELYLTSKTKGAIDTLQEKVISRKLLVFGTATALLVYAGLAADTWGMIAMMYIGGQSAVDFAKIWKG
jgi:hypothetical protein|tara:strand:- start:19614 stop:19883 length:270 start_codon:yes stop_codon:yes gene_type:complete